jgi:hypothetical protein
VDKGDSSPSSSSVKPLYWNAFHALLLAIGRAGFCTDRDYSLSTLWQMFSLESHAWRGPFWSRHSHVHTLDGFRWIRLLISARAVICKTLERVSLPRRVYFLEEVRDIGDHQGRVGRFTRELARILRVLHGLDTVNPLPRRLGESRG